MSEPLLDKYVRALNYPRVAARHQLRAGEIAAQVNGIRRIATLVIAADLPNVIPEDPADNMVVATGVAGNVHYIVSGDDDLHRLGEYDGIQVLSSALFLTVLRL